MSPFSFYKMLYNKFLSDKSRFSLFNSGQLDIRVLVFFLALILFSVLIGFKIARLQPLIPVGILLGIAVGIATLVNTNFGLTILIFSMLLSPEIPLAQTPERAVVIRIEDFLIIAVFFAWLAKMAVRKELGLLRKTPLNKPIFAYLGITILSTLLGIATGDIKPLTSIFYVLKYIEFFMIFFLFVNNLEDMKQIKTFIACFLFVSFIIGILTYAQIGKIDRPTAPFEGAHAEPNTLAGYLVMTLAIALGILLYSGKPNVKFILGGLVCFNFYPLLMTLSRSSYVAFMTIYLFLISLSRRHRMILVGLLVAAILFLPILIPDRVKDRVVNTFRYGSHSTMGGGRISLDQSAQARFQGWQYAVKMLQKRPFFGYGVTGLGMLDSQYARILGETGIVGFIIFLWLLFAILKSSWVIFNNSTDNYCLGLSLGFLCGFIGMLVMSFGANVFVIVRISEPLWFLCACVMVLPELEKLQAQESLT